MGNYVCGNRTQALRYIHTAQDWDRYRDQIESIVQCGNVHTGLRQGRDQGPLFPIVPVPFHALVLVLFPCSVNKPLLCCTNKNSSTKNGYMYVCGDMKFEQSTVVSFVNAHRKLLDISFNCNRYLATSATEYVCVSLIIILA